MAEIVSYVVPKRLYRYRSLKNREQELDNLQRNELYFSPFNAQNDPMEGYYRQSGRSSQALSQQVIDRIFDRKLSIGLCAFSETKYNELMWAHYADKFGGICVSFDVQKLLSKLSNEFELVRMHYAEELPAIRRTDDIDTAAKKVLSSKNYRWSYEREWRLFAPSTGRASYQTKSVVSRVYIGGRVSDSDRRSIASRLTGAGFEVRQMKTEGYRLKWARF